ncbi:MAG: hypothetical protein R3F59_38280 [Myxococcota bacterium]
MSTRPLLLLAGLTACGRPDTTPTWAYDPIWLEPAVQGEVHGFQTWELYGPKWIDNSDDRAYACAVVVELFGAPVACDADPGCTVAWELAESEIVSTDCDEATTADPLFGSLLRVGIGGLIAGEQVPYPGQTSTGWADYGNGWEVHGYAYPEALDLGALIDTTDWDGVQPFQLVPSQSFELGGEATSTPGTGA